MSGGRTKFSTGNKGLAAQRAIRIQKFMHRYSTTRR